MSGKNTRTPKTKTQEARKHDQNPNRIEDDSNTTSDIKTLLSSILTEIKEIKRQNEDLMKETKKDITDLKEEIQSIDKKLEEKCATLETKITTILSTTNDKTKQLEDDIKALQKAEEQRKNREKTLETRTNPVPNSTNDKTKQLEADIKTLQENEERRQRSEKRRNIIIKSMEFGEDSLNTVHTKVEEILRKMDHKDGYIRARYIGKDRTEKGLVRVELNRLEDKIAIMKNKSKLKGQDCFIDDDMTKKEPEIQAVLRQRAREERAKGNTVKVGYQKIMINNQWENWQPASSHTNI